ncbi:MAG: CpaF family protein [Lachnospiraceae bacterium]|nr:CpaF family protein [Lachnospiraceae bacterium]
MNNFQNIKNELSSEIRADLDMAREMDDEEIGNIIDTHILEKSRRTYLSSASKLALRQELFNSIRKLDFLQELVDDPQITEIMVNGLTSIFYEKEGRIYLWDKRFDSREKLENVIRRITARANRTINEKSPIVDARLTDGSRVNVVLDPVALNGPILTIRKFSEKPISLSQLTGWGSISPEAAEYMKVMVQAGYNIFISGGTGTGKTTFLNALADHIPAGTRIVTIEDSAELQIHNIENLVRLEVRQGNSEGENSVTMRDLIKTSLRMRPDRIIVGEVRGPEALDMIQAMNTGHDGSMSTGHANSPEDMLSRLETMVLMGSDIPLNAIRKQIVSSIDIIVQLGRLRDCSRRVTEITEVLGCRDNEYLLNPLFVFRENPGPGGIKEPEPELAEETSFYGVHDSKAVSVISRVNGELVRTGNHLVNRKKLLSSALERPEL